jgi:hypothetical protein
MIECDIYRTSKSKHFVFVSTGAGTTKLPKDVHDKLGPLKKWKTVTTGPAMIGADPRKIEQDIAKDGYSIGAAEVKTTVTVGKQPPR